MEHSMRDMALAPAVKDTPTVQTISPMPVDRTGYPGQGLEGEPDVLTYRDLVALDRNPDPRPPSRPLQIHPTGHLEPYMCAFDGVTMNAVTAPRSEKRAVGQEGEKTGQH